MYRRHFGLNDKPFTLVPDPDYLYLSPKHAMGLTMLEYGLTETAAGIILVTGDVGAGKTTLLRKLMRRIDHQELTIGLVSNTGSVNGDLLRWVAVAFNLPHEGKDAAGMFQTFQRFLIDEYIQGRRVILIIDEAQNLNGATLEELRMLCNIHSAGDQLLQIVLVGQPELLDMLVRPEAAQIAQRVSVEYHLGPLTLDETREYIAHRLSVAGATDPIFMEDAVLAVFVCSGGVPRLINTLCDYALVYAYGNDMKTVTGEIIKGVVSGRRVGGIARGDNVTEEVLQAQQQLWERYGIELGPQRSPSADGGVH